MSTLLAAPQVSALMSMSAVHCPGALPMLLAFFKHSRRLACSAYCMISALLDGEGFTDTYKRSTASMLIRMSAIHCFSTLLEPIEAAELPGDTYRTCKAPVICVLVPFTAPAVLLAVKLKWCPYLDTDGSSEEVQQLTYLHSFIHVMNITLMYGVVRSEASFTAAEWLALVPVISRTAAAARLLLTHPQLVKLSATHDPNNEQTCKLLEDCQKMLQIVLGRLVIDHLPNPELDQSQVIHAMLLPVLIYWEPAAAFSAVSSRLALALLKRAAEDTAVLVHNNEVLQEVQLQNMDVLWHTLGERCMNTDTTLQTMFTH